MLPFQRVIGLNGASIKSTENQTLELQLEILRRQENKIMTLEGIQKACQMKSHIECKQMEA